MRDKHPKIKTKIPLSEGAPGIYRKGLQTRQRRQGQDIDTSILQLYISDVKPLQRNHPAAKQRFDNANRRGIDNTVPLYTIKKICQE
jgi:hypothetical protein